MAFVDNYQQLLDMYKSQGWKIKRNDKTGEHIVEKAQKGCVVHFFTIHSFIIHFYCIFAPENEGNMQNKKYMNSMSASTF